MNLRERQCHVRQMLLAEEIDEGSLAAGMAIYRNAYRMRLLEVLRATFAKTLAWIGDEAFDTAARHYILQRPPTSFTLDVYGADLVPTLSTLFGNDPEVAELAWLEWHLQQAFAAIDEPVLDGVRFAAAVNDGLDWERVPLRTVGSVALRSIDTHCTDIWKALTACTPAPSTWLRDQPAWLLVWRQALTPQFRLLDADEHAALQRLSRGCTLADLTGDEHTHASTDSPDAARLGEWLARWIAEGVIACPATLEGLAESTGRPTQVP